MHPRPVAASAELARETLGGRAARRAPRRPEGLDATAPAGDTLAADISGRGGRVGCSEGKEEVTCFSECVSSETQFHETTIHTGPRGRCPRSPLAGARTSDRTDAGLAPAPVRLPRHGTERHLQPGQVVGVAARGREERQPRARGTPASRRVCAFSSSNAATGPPAPRARRALVRSCRRACTSRRTETCPAGGSRASRAAAASRAIPCSRGPRRANTRGRRGRAGEAAAARRRRFPPLLLARETDDAPAPCVGSPARRAGVSVVRKRQVLRVRRRGGDIFFRLRTRAFGADRLGAVGDGARERRRETRTRRTETAWDT